MLRGLIVPFTKNGIPFSQGDLDRMLGQTSTLHFLHSSRDGAFLIRVEEQFGAGAADFASKYFVDNQARPNVVTRQHLLIEAEILRHLQKGRSPSFNVELKRLEKITSEMDEVLVGAKDQLAATAKQFEEDRAKSNELDKKHHLRRYRFYRKRFDEGIEIYREALSDLDSTRAAYDEHMKLRAAAKYWQDKAADHETYSGTAGMSILAFLILASVITVIGAVAALNGNLATPGRDTNGILAVALFAALISFAIIGARLLSWNYRRQVAAGEDARQRAAMTKTFLALIKDSAVESDDRAMILEALFRPAGGSDKTEGNNIPTSPAAMAAMIALSRPRSGGA